MKPPATVLFEGLLSIPRVRTTRGMFFAIPSESFEDRIAFYCFEHWEFAGDDTFAVKID